MCASSSTTRARPTPSANRVLFAASAQQVSRCSDDTAAATSPAAATGAATPAPRRSQLRAAALNTTLIRTMGFALIDGDATPGRKSFVGREENRLCRLVNTREWGPGAFLRRTGPDASNSTRPNNGTPADTCGRVTGDIRRRCFVPAPGRAGGARAPITCRSRRTLRGGAR